MGLNDTPRSERLNIGIFGKRNVGKSSLINALTGQDIAVVSPVAGTTTDPVYKSMEIHGIGPVVFIDTAGFDDVGDLGNMRISKTMDALKRTDIAILVLTECPDSDDEWIKMLKTGGVPIIPVLNKVDTIDDVDAVSRSIEAVFNKPPVLVSVKSGIGLEKIRECIIRSIPEDFRAPIITHGLVSDGDTVVLVMPQDKQAPKGRLILPQVQTIRELLDLKCIVISTVTEKLSETLAALKHPPKLIITDSQVFKTVYDLKPEESMLTSFSVLMAGYKGDIKEFVEGAYAIAGLTETSRVLIAEACTHAPLTEDIGREKIPALLRKRVGEGLSVDVVSGVNFPEDLNVYDIIIHCGACMFNRKYVLSRIEQAKNQGVPITNYGVVIAYLSGILDKVTF